MVKKRPVLAVDFDDIVAGFNRAYHQWNNRFFGTSFSYEELVTFDMCALYGIDTRTLYKRMDRFVQEHHHEILPVEGAKEGLRKLSNVCDLHVVTSRCESLHPITTGWVRNAAFEYFEAFHFTNGFNSIYPEKKRKKVDVCKEIGAIALIDDADSNALEVAQGGLPVFMLELPWNGKAQHELITRVRSWSEIVHEVHKLLEAQVQPSP